MEPMTVSDPMANLHDCAAIYRPFRAADAPVPGSRRNVDTDMICKARSQPRGLRGCHRAGRLACATTGVPVQVMLRL